MKWLVAPNAFKGTIEADRAAELIKSAIIASNPIHEVSVCPIADGGDGTCHLLSEILALEKISAMACGPLGSPMEGFFSLDATTNTAFLDVSTVSGIKWLKEFQKDPWTCSSYGTGELVVKAIELGAKEIVMGLGGSATVDMGTGILRALGFLFLDKNGREIPVFSPGFITQVAHIQQTKKISDIKFIILCDVENTYFGDRGAIPVFGPQKGLKETDFGKFEQASQNVFELLQKKSKLNLTDKKGFGAAGGIALGLSAFFETRLVSGAQYFFEKVKIADRIRGADIVITGEGKYDKQSDEGKGSHELLKLSHSLGKEIWLITSGKDARGSDFDRVLELPDLDFGSPDLISLAENSLVGTVREALD
ncbi:glycerate kinase family protein [Lunatibacter salilacus]|uniref:glycerate kinase family protein n=1 Tax=Lunatibacter salilacus TaxID=2483804 RepID=UPI00131ACE49|nr:glycerate kinase [Lunatibacter salilacus]